MNFMSDITGLTAHPVINNRVYLAKDVPNNITPFFSPTRNQVTNQSTQSTPTSHGSVVNPKTNQSTHTTPSSNSRSAPSPAKEINPNAGQCSLCHQKGHNKRACKNEPCNGHCNEKKCAARKKIHQEEKNKAVLSGKQTNAKWHNILDKAASQGMNNTDVLTSVVNMIQNESTQFANNGKKRSHASFVDSLTLDTQLDSDYTQRSTSRSQSPLTIHSSSSSEASSSSQSCYSVSDMYDDRFEYGLGDYLRDTNHTSSNNNNNNTEIANLKSQLKIVTAELEKHKVVINRLLDVVNKTSEAMSNQAKRLKL